jgi:hypothetical protein
MKMLPVCVLVLAHWLMIFWKVWIYWHVGTYVRYITNMSYPDGGCMGGFPFDSDIYCWMIPIRHN